VLPVLQIIVTQGLLIYMTFMTEAMDEQTTGNPSEPPKGTLATFLSFVETHRTDLMAGNDILESVVEKPTHLDQEDPC
jgi:hypothetical protein